MSRMYCMLFLISAVLGLNVSRVLSEGPAGGVNPPVEASTTELRAERAGKELHMTAELPKDVRKIEVRIESCRNRRISRMSDVSPFDPNPESSGEIKELQRDVWYPAVDVAIEPGMEAVAHFDVRTPGKCVVNGPFHVDEKEIAGELVILAGKLEAWENSIQVEPAANRLTGFYLRRHFPVVTGRFDHIFKLLSEDWSGLYSDNYFSRLTTIRIPG